jgi:hypothetical protein
VKEKRRNVFVCYASTTVAFLPHKLWCMLYKKSAAKRTTFSKRKIDKKRVILCLSIYYILYVKWPIGILFLCQRTNDDNDDDDMKMPCNTDNLLNMHSPIAVHWSGWLITIRSTKNDEQGRFFSMFSSLFSYIDSEWKPKGVIIIYVYKHSDKSTFSFSTYHWCHHLAILLFQGNEHTFPSDHYHYRYY